MPLRAATLYPFDSRRPFVLGHAAQVGAGHRLAVLDDEALAGGQQDDARLIVEADVRLLDPLVGAQHGAVQAGEQRQLLLRGHVGPAGAHRVPLRQPPLDAEAGGGGPGRAVGDGSRGLGATFDRLQREIFGVAVAGLVALDHPHAHPQPDVGGGAVDDPVLERQPVRDDVLEKQVGAVAPPGHRRGQHLADEPLVHAEAGEVVDAFPGAPAGEPGRAADKEIGGGGCGQRAAPPHETTATHPVLLRIHVFSSGRMFQWSCQDAPVRSGARCGSATVCDNLTDGPGISGDAWGGSSGSG